LITLTPLRSKMR